MQHYIRDDDDDDDDDKESNYIITTNDLPHDVFPIIFSYIISSTLKLLPLSPTLPECMKWIQVNSIWRRHTLKYMDSLYGKNDKLVIENRCAYIFNRYAPKLVEIERAPFLSDGDIMKCTSLTKLTLFNNKITDKGLLFLTALKVLKLSVCHRISYKSLDRLTNLTKLKCDDSCVSNDDIRQLTNLKSLNLKYLHQFELDSPMFLSLINLKRLKLNDCGIYKSYLARPYLINLPQLEKLSLRSTYSSVGLRLDLLTNLKTLKLHGITIMKNLCVSSLTSLRLITVDKNFHGTIPLDEKSNVIIDVR